VQTEWHKWVDADHPRGWDNQLRNEPGLLLAYLEKWRYGPVTGVQAVPHFGATLGNVMTLVRAGGIVRLGQNMSGFGPDTIEPGGAMLQRTRLTDSQSQNGGREWYVFAGVDARLVGRNIFLDGNTFRDGPSVERKGYVHDFKAGFSLRIAPMRISLTHVRRSPEFTTPAGGSGIQRFHSLNVGWEF
jgi:lipid A 3-O-deacylase